MTNQLTTTTGRALVTVPASAEQKGRFFNEPFRFTIPEEWTRGIVIGYLAQIGGRFGLGSPQMFLLVDGVVYESEAFVKSIRVDMYPPDMATGYQRPDECTIEVIDVHPENLRGARFVRSEFGTLTAEYHFYHRDFYVVETEVPGLYIYLLRPCLELIESYVEPSKGKEISRIQPYAFIEE